MTNTPPTNTPPTTTPPTTTPPKTAPNESASRAAEKNNNPFAPRVESYPAADPVLGCIDSRTSTSLNGTWRMIIDPMGAGDPGSLFGGFVRNRQPSSDMELVEFNYEAAQTVEVPGDFNTQDERLFFYQGRVWYYRTFENPAVANARQHLCFDGANFVTTVFLNGKGIGEHGTGYVPFSFDITQQMCPGTNTLIVRVDNRLSAETVPTSRTDWWPYGGLTRDVALVETPLAYIRNANLALLDRQRGRIRAQIDTVGMAPGTTGSIRLPELGIDLPVQIDAAGQAELEFDAQPILWSPQTPQLYDVHFVAGDDHLHDRVGLRTIETRGETIVLNGEALKLRGIATHEEAIGRDGVAYSDADVRGLLAEAKALNANFVRAAHYPYSRHMARAADELGLLLWEEIPVYWNIAWDNPATLVSARNLINRLVQRDWNRASVIIWSIANETPISADRMAFMGTLIDDVRAADPTRLVSAALFGNPRDELREVALHIAARGAVHADTPAEARAIFQGVLAKAGDRAPGPEDPFHLTITDPLGEALDVVGYNQYFGWYYSGIFARQMGVGEEVLRPLMLELMPHIRVGASVSKPLVISEFGAGAKVGHPGNGVFSEAYQARVYRAQIQMLSNGPQVQGMTPWILKDFRAMLRTLPGVQDYRNRKGLMDENGQRKEAFGVLQAFYAEHWQ